MDAGSTPVCEAIQLKLKDMRNFIVKTKKGDTPKYRNTKCEFMGIHFDSKREMQRYILLKDAEAKGTISHLEVHPKYELIPAVVEDEVIHMKTKDKVVQRVAQKAITYVADFRYIKDGETIVEDVKISEHLLPKEFVLKCKMMYALKGISVKKVYKPNEAI